VAVDRFSLGLSHDTPTFTTIAGESGSGKTTIARLLLGLIEPTSGEVRFRGRLLGDLSGDERRQFRREVQAIFQDPFEVYNPFYKIDHILTTPLRKFGLTGGRQRIGEALEAVGLRPDETLGRYPHQLSGGQRQRITIARALLLEPRLIIADEPVSMVDASLRATILESLHRLYRDFGISFLYITHDLTTAYQVSDHLVVLFHGDVAEVGGVAAVVDAPEHPYTQELIGSIPVPEPGSDWLEGSVEARDEEDVVAAEHLTQVGCRYAHRCPRAMDRCATRHPDLYRTAPDRAVACYLHDEAPPLPHMDLTTVIESGRGE
jgi:peptide/nickel transport system ATP-binding protein